MAWRPTTEGTAPTFLSASLLLSPADRWDGSEGEAT